MRRMSIVVPSALILFIAACAAPRESEPLPATAGATVFEGARLITGDKAPPIEDSASLDESASSSDFQKPCRKSVGAL